MATHPKGTRARILLSSVFGPYAQDDEFGSRTINPMELYHNQVTRAQGPFSLRMFHRSWGILMIQENISAPSTVLDFPTREASRAELLAQPIRHRRHLLDHRECRQGARDVPHGARALAALDDRGRRARRGHSRDREACSTPTTSCAATASRGCARYLGEDRDAPIRHPEIVSGFETRILGLKLPQRRGATAATIIPSVGCPMGCNFCTTSAFFGGKGKFLNFYNTGEELFDVMCEMEATLGVKSFFMMDENFLLHRRRALRTAGTDEGTRARAGRWTCSPRPMRSGKYTMRELVELGVSWIWMGLESPRSHLRQAARRGHSRNSRANCASTAFECWARPSSGWSITRRRTSSEEIEHAVSHDTDFHQFMLYTPVPGTPLYRRR